MANEIFENIWKFMKENKFQLINQISDDLICNICNKLMVKACNAPCGCKYCFDCIEIYLDGKDKFCPGKDKLCQMKMINFEKDLIIDYGSNIRITKIIVKCGHKSCKFTDEMGLIENHMRTCEMKGKCEQIENIDMEMFRIIDEIFDKNADLIRKSFNYDENIKNLQIKCEQKENKGIEMTRIINELFDKNADLKKKFNNYDEKINNLQRKLIEMERITEFNKFEWLIENFSKKKDGHIYSEPFYSHKNGYKMCLSARIDGNCIGVYFLLMNGEFDNYLSWPFKHAITIAIINQMNGAAYKSETMKYNHCSYNESWRKPTTDRNGDICFIYLNKSREMTRNDQMLIKCNIKN